MSFLEVDHLTSGYGNRKIVRNVCFRVEENTLVGILGANGCGKTTLLKALCGILPSDGERVLLGQSLAGLSERRLARICRYIPQRSGIGIDISALDVVLMGFNPVLGLLEYPSTRMYELAKAALERVGLGECAQTNYQTLSEGQKQLVIMARTLILEQGMLFLDEPESALDFGGRYRILELVRSWISEPCRAAVVTLHDPQLALNCCDRLLLMRDGAVQDALSPGSDSAEEMERKLSGLYGPLTVCRCHTHSGKEQWVLLKET